MGAGLGKAEAAFVVEMGWEARFLCLSPSTGFRDFICIQDLSFWDI